MAFPEVGLQCNLGGVSFSAIGPRTAKVLREFLGYSISFSCIL